MITQWTHSTPYSICQNSWVCRINKESLSLRYRGEVLITFAIRVFAERRWIENICYGLVFALSDILCSETRLALDYSM